MAAGYDGSIRINTKLDRNGFNQGLNAIAGSLKKLGGAMGVAFGVTAMVKFGKEALNIASDLTEVQNVVETAFGAMSSQVDTWAKKLHPTVWPERAGRQAHRVDLYGDECRNGHGWAGRGEYGDGSRRAHRGYCIVF